MIYTKEGTIEVEGSIPEIATDLHIIYWALKKREPVEGFIDDMWEKATVDFDKLISEEDLKDFSETISDLAESIRRKHQEIKVADMLLNMSEEERNALREKLKGDIGYEDNSTGS